MTAMPTRRDLFRRVGALAATLLPLSPDIAFAATPAGAVIAMGGSCFVEAQGQRTALKIGASVNVGDTIDVPAGSKLKLRLSDGSVISIASGTRMTVTACQVDAAGQRQDVNLSLAQGLVHAVVAPVEHPAGFEVSTAVGVAAVRSTDWFIEAQSGSAQVGVLAGSVSLTSAATTHAVTIPARWGARLEAGRDPVPARVWSPAEFEAVIARTNLN